jgi:hypothetical protein
LTRAASKKLLLLSLALAACSSALAACGDDEEEGAAATKVSIEATGGGKNVRLKAPKSVEGGLVEISFKNSANSPQEAGIIRVVGDHSVAEVLKVTETEGGPIPRWLRTGGGVGMTDPGQTAKSTQELPAGKYYVIGGGEEEGKPPTTSFTVEGGDGGGELPETDSKITMKEYSFAATGLKPGRNRVLVENTGRELHHTIAAPMRKGATLADVRKFAASEEEPEGPQPIDFRASRNTPVLDGGVRQVLDLDLKKKGNYALICFIQDRKGGPPHVVKGMIAQTTVR